jgi:hypothetical protein
LSGEVDISISGTASSFVRFELLARLKPHSKMAARGDDALLDGDLPPQSAWDQDEWEW